MDTTPTPSLYDQLGGREAITAVVARLYELIAQDPSVSVYFTETGMPAKSLTEFVIAATGGEKDPAYTMPDLAGVHKKFGITGEAFATVGGYLQQALQEFNVPKETIDATMALIVGTRPQIIADNEV